jgi:hypothetical protein
MSKKQSLFAGSADVRGCSLVEDTKASSRAPHYFALPYLVTRKTQTVNTPKVTIWRMLG